jgi:hypothetical protein
MAKEKGQTIIYAKHYTKRLSRTNHKKPGMNSSAPLVAAVCSTRKMSCEMEIVLKTSIPKYK